MRQSLVFRWTCLAFACSFALASAVAAPGGNGGGKGRGDSGGHGAGNSGHDAGSGKSTGNGGRGVGKGGEGAGDSRGGGRKGIRGDSQEDDNDDADGSRGKSSEDGDADGSPVTGGSAATDDADPDDPPSAGGKATGATATDSATAARAANPNRSGGGQSLDLPSTLQPFGGSVSLSMTRPTETLPGVPAEILRACRDAIESAAAPFSATSVRVSSAGSMQQSGRDTLTAPLAVSIDYARQGGVETRQAEVSCRLNAAGDVTGLT